MIFVSLRSYGYSFHRNILIFAPIFVLLLELIENFNCKILGNKIQLIGILFFAIFGMVRPATDGRIYIKNNFYLSEVDKEIVRDISSCSQYIDEIAKPYSKISIDVNRSLEGAFLHEPNYWRYIFMPFDVNLVIYIKILRGDFQDYDYSEAKDIFIASKPLHGYFKNKSCEVKIYKVNE